MSPPISRKLVEGRSGELFVVEGNPTAGYTLHHAQLSEVGHFKRSWEAVRRAENGHDETEPLVAAVTPPQRCCGNLSLDGFLGCTRPEGHTGDHAAHGESDTEPLEVWAQ